MIVVCKPRRYPRANLSEEHKEEVDYWLTRLLLRVQGIPSSLILWLVAWRYVACCLDAEAILYKRKEVAHQQRLPYKAHYQAVKSKDKEAVGIGTNITLHGKQRESNQAHHLLAAHANQRIEERRERRHTYGRYEAKKSYVFRLDAKPAHHLTTVDGVGTAYRHYRYEKYDEKGYAKRLWHPVIERKILRQMLRHRRIYLCLCHYLS